MSVLLCLSLSAGQFYADDYTDDELMEIRSIISLRLSEPEKGNVIYEDDYVTISYLGWKTDWLDYIQLWVTAVNKSDINLDVNAKSTFVNDCSGYISVLAGKRVNKAILSISPTTLEEQWIDDIEYAEFAIHYSDSDDWWNGYSFTTTDTFVIEYDPE